MSSEATRSELVVGVDGSVASYAAVSWAAHEATMRGLPIKLVHVVAPTLMSSTMAPNDTITQEQEDKARQILDQARRIVDERTARHRRTSTPSSGTQVWLQRLSMRQEMRR